MDVMAAPHLVFEKTCQQQALRARGFHQRRIAVRAHIRDEVIEHGNEISRSGHRSIAVDRYLRVMREHTGVVEELLLIDSGLRYVLQVHYEELQRAPVIAPEQFD